MRRLSNFIVSNATRCLSDEANTADDIHSIGYPVISHLTKTSMTTQGGFNLGGINSTGQVGRLESR